MSNRKFKPNHGDVYKYGDIYRMYVKLPSSETLLCVKLSTGESYVHSEDNGLVDTKYEQFVFNMCDIVGEE